MTDREYILTYVKEKYGIEADYPWAKYASYAVLRHKQSRKWFGVLMKVPARKLGIDKDQELDVMNIKCDPFLSDELRQETGFLSAYHMNKEHWLTVILSASQPVEKICRLLDLSYELTK